MRFRSMVMGQKGTKSQIESPRKVLEEPLKEKILREHLVNLLSGRGAHVDFAGNEFGKK